MGDCGYELKHKWLGNVSNYWPAETIVVRNQTSFNAKTSFVNAVSASTGANEKLSNVKRQKLEKRSTMYKERQNGDPIFTQNSKAWSFNLEDLVDYTVPEYKTLLKLDSICSFGIWYTSAELETGGDDSNNIRSSRKKVYIERKTEKVYIERQTRERFQAY